LCPRNSLKKRKKGKNHYEGAPKVKKIVYKFFPEDVTDKQLVEALKKGEVDMVKVTDEKVGKTAGSPFQIKNLADPFISFLWLDTSREKSPYVDKKPNPLKDKAVRQAIYRTIDVNKMIKGASLSAAPASQMVTEAIFGYNPNITRSKPSVSEAKKLMKQAGVSDGFQLTLDVPGYLEPVGKAIADDLAKIGIIAKVNPIASRDEAGIKWWDEQDVSAYIMDYGAETYDSGEIFTNIISSSGDINYLAFGYGNDGLDKLAEDISSTFEKKARQLKLKEAMSKAMEEMPMIPLYSQKIYYIVRNNFDWTPTAFGAIYGSEISGRKTTN
jgi:peptide/nickel transport system substrate-binding protein